jgi:hypothetical protein
MERQILMALIMSKEFLGQVSPVLDLSLLESNHFRQIAEWCLKYFEEYKKAPKGHIEAIYYAWAENGDRDPAQVEAIHDYLEHLSSQYDSASDLNVPYLLDQTGRFLTLKRLQRLNDDLSYNLTDGDAEAAQQALNAYRGIEIGRGVGVDPLNNDGVWEAAFSDPAQPLIKFPGDAGRFLNDALTRDALIGIQAPEKRGKTWWCVEFVMRALRNRKKVALFEVGDMSESQIMLRMGVRLSGRPLRESHCGEIQIPSKIYPPRNKENKITGVDHRTKFCPHPISEKSCLKAVKRFMRGCGIPSEIPYVMVSTHPNSTVNVRQITAILEMWEVEKGFVPDVIVIDYADILTPEDPKKQARDQINDTWKALRRLSQEKHCLVIAPTQADAASYDAKTQSMKNFSEDKRKYAHVTGMLGLNQTEEDRKNNVMRLNWLVLRESEFDAWKILWVGQCFKLGKALCCSAF